MNELLMLSLALGLGCTDAGKKPDGPSGQKKGATKSAQKKAVTKLPLSGLSALKYLPRQTMVVASTGNALEVSKRFGYAELKASLGATWLEGAAEVTRELGHNFLEPEGWKAIGVDVEGPIGFAWLDGPNEAFTFFVRLKDPKAFDAFLDRMQKKERDKLVTEPHGEARVVRPERDQDVALVFRGEWAFIAGSGRRGWRALTAARWIATVAEKDSLAALPELPKDLEALGYGRDLNGWVHSAELGEALVREFTNNRDSDFVRRRLAILRERGEGQEADRLEARLRPRSDNPLRMAKQKAAAGFMRSMLNVFGGIAAGVELEPQRVGLVVDLSLAPESLPRRIVTPVKGPNRLSGAMTETPTWMGHARVNVKALLELFNGAMLAGGEARELGEIKTASLEHLGFDILAEADSIFTGEIGLGIATGPQGMMGLMQGQGGGVFLLGLKDAKKVKAALEKLLAEPLVSGEFTREGAHYRATRAPMPLVFGFVEGYFVASTDVAALDRVAKADASKSFVSGLWNPKIKALLQAPDANFTWVQDWNLISFAVGMGRGAGDKRFNDIISKLGHLAFTARGTKRGFRVEGGQYLGLDRVGDLVSMFGSMIEDEQRGRSRSPSMPSVVAPPAQVAPVAPVAPPPEAAKQAPPN